jgi:hypothetical protein
MSPAHGTARRGLRGRTVPHYGSCQSRPPARAASWSVCMAWGTGTPRVVEGELVRRVAPRSSGSCLGQRRKLLVRTSSLSEARRRLLVRGADLSEKPPPSKRLVGEASNWSEIRRLASEGLDKDPLSSLY